MEKIVGMNAVKEVLKSDKNVEKLEIYKGVKKDTIKEFEEAISKTDGKMTEGTFQSEKTKKASNRLINTIAKTYNIT